MGDESQKLTAPVTLQRHEDDRISLTFGPMPWEDLAEVMATLATPEGQLEFLDGLQAGIATHNQPTKEN